VAPAPAAATLQSVFRGHGAWRQGEAATAARDVPVGESWAFRDHRTMAEVLADEAAF
jgi:hypothetical protein